MLFLWDLKIVVWHNVHRRKTIEWMVVTVNIKIRSGLKTITQWILLPPGLKQPLIIRNLNWFHNIQGHKMLKLSFYSFCGFTIFDNLGMTNWRSSSFFSAFLNFFTRNLFIFLLNSNKPIRNVCRSLMMFNIYVEGETSIKKISKVGNFPNTWEFREFLKCLGIMGNFPNTSESGKFTK